MCMCKSVCVCVCVHVLSHVQLFATPWPVALRAPMSEEFSRQAYWNGLSFPTPGDLPDPEIKLTSLVSPTLQADSLPLSHQGSPDIVRYQHLKVSFLSHHRVFALWFMKTYLIRSRKCLSIPSIVLLQVGVELYQPLYLCLL